MKYIHRFGLLLLIYAIIMCIKYGGIPTDDHLFAEIAVMAFLVGGGICLLYPTK